MPGSTGDFVSRGRLSATDNNIVAQSVVAVVLFYISVPAMQFVKTQTVHIFHSILPTSILTAIHRECAFIHNLCQGVSVNFN